MSDGQGIFGVFFCTIIYIEEGLIMPTITLFATFVHNGLSNWFCNWIQLAFLCFPVALCLQLFFVGPLVRLIFRTLFPAQN